MGKVFTIEADTEEDAVREAENKVYQLEGNGDLHENIEPVAIEIVEIIREE